MSSDLQFADFRGKSAQCYYDITLGKVHLRFGESYEEQEEAEFFGDSLPKGAASGVAFSTVSGYSSSNRSHIQIGTVADIVWVGGGKCLLELVNDDVPSLGGRVEFAFRTMDTILA